MAFGTTPISTTTLGANQFPVSGVAVPNAAGGNLTALEGGPKSTDSNGNDTAPASMYLKDGGNVTQGAQADAAASTDTGTFSFMALFKRSLQSLTSIITNTGRIPAQGQVAMAASTPVTIASDQTPKITATATRSNVAAAVVDTSLLASNAARKGAIFFNDSTAILYLAYGAGAASTTSYSVQVPANGYFELPPEPVFTGAIRGIWSAANGSLRVTELT